MEEAKISIIVPAYNVEQYIHKTLKSIINQSYSSLELIIINDGSSDDTLKIMEETLSSSTIDYQIINKENEGVSEARNDGIKSSKGDYIFFLDGDDFIAEDCLEKMYSALKEGSCQSSYANYLKIRESGQVLNKNTLKLPKTAKNEFLIKLEARMSITFTFCQLLYSADIIRKNKLFFNPELEYGEDTEFALRYLAHSPRIAFVEEDLIYYLQRENSSTSQALFKRYDFIKALDNIIEYYKENNMPHEILNLIATSRIPRSIWGNTIFLLDASVPCKEVINELEQRNLISRLNSFRPAQKKDYLFLLKLKTFSFSPRLYYLLRKILKH